MDCENWLMLTETDWLHFMALTLCFFHVSTCTMSPCISCMPYAVRYSLLALPKRLELVPRHGRKGGRFSPVVLCGRLVSVSCFHSLYYFFCWLRWIEQQFLVVLSEWVACSMAVLVTWTAWPLQFMIFSQSSCSHHNRVCSIRYLTELRLRSHLRSLRVSTLSRTFGSIVCFLPGRARRKTTEKNKPNEQQTISNSELCDFSFQLCVTSQKSRISKFKLGGSKCDFWPGCQVTNTPLSLYTSMTSQILDSSMHLKVGFQLSMPLVPDSKPVS